MTRIVPSIFLCVLIPVTAWAGAQGSGRTKAMPNTHMISTETAAIERAKKLTGLEALTSRIVAHRLVIQASNVPFLAGQVNGKEAWRVDFLDAPLKLKGAIPGFQDAYPRQFSVLILQDTGQLVQVYAPYLGKASAPEMRDPPTAESAQRQLEGGEEVYEGFPTADPKINFLDALGIVLTKGSGSPFLAKAIEGVYVMESCMEAAPRPVWAITLRGLPPFSAHGPYADSVPEWQRNHMRNVLDATTGELLFAINSPQPY